MYKVSLLLTPSDGLLCEMACGDPAEVRIYRDGTKVYDICTKCLVEAVDWYKADLEADLAALTGEVG